LGKIYTYDRDTDEDRPHVQIHQYDAQNNEDNTYERIFLPKWLLSDATHALSTVCPDDGSPALEVVDKSRIRYSFPSLQPDGTLPRSLVQHALSEFPIKPGKKSVKQRKTRSALVSRSLTTAEPVEDADTTPLPGAPSTSRTPAPTPSSSSMASASTRSSKNHTKIARQVSTVPLAPTRRGRKPKAKQMLTYD